MKAIPYCFFASTALATTFLIGSLTPAFAEPSSAFDDFARIASLKAANQDTELVAAGEKFLADHPGSPGEDVVIFYLGQSFTAKKEHADTIRVLSKLLKDHGDSPLVTAAAMQRGEAYRHTEKHAEMLPDFQRAYQGYKEAGNENDAAHAQYHIVQAYNFLKETGKATAEAELLIKDYPSSNYAKNAAQLMKLKAPAAPAAAAAASSPRGLAVGTEAPDVEMVILSDNAKKNLSDFKGKVVVLDFWASWCGPCQAPMAKMQTYREKHPEWGDKVELIALSIDNTKEGASGHLEKKGWDKTLNAWAGEGGFRSKPPQAYQVRGIPTVYVIDPDGRIAATGHPNSIDIPEIVSGLLKKG